METLVSGLSLPIHNKPGEAYRCLAACHVCLLLFAFAFPVSAFAFSPNTAVYVREGTSEDGDWTPATYVGARSDCLILERLRPYPGKAPFLKIPAQFNEEKVEVGDEVEEVWSAKALPNSKMPRIIDRVLAVQQPCHEVKHAGGPFSLYVLAENILEAAELKNLRGIKRELSIGDKVYSEEYSLTPERWSLREVTAKRDDCFETDSDRVLCGHFTEEEYLTAASGQLFKIPLGFTKPIKKGDVLDGLSLRTESSTLGTTYTTLEGTTETKTKDTLTLKSSNEDCSYAPIHVPDIRQAPPPLSATDFAALQPGDVVLEKVEPACCCCSPYYLPRKIISPKRRGYLVRKGAGAYDTEARFSSQLIPAEHTKQEPHK